MEANSDGVCNGGPATLPLILSDDEGAELYRFSVVRGGLISYGPDLIAQFRGAATYVDRILKGEQPGDLPIQAPTKYLLVVNLKVAKSLGIQLSPSLLARADEVIE